MRKLLSILSGLIVLSVGLSLVGVGATAVAAPSAKYVVTATANKTVAITGTKVVVRGKVKPAAPGSVVVLQQRAVGKRKWSESGTAKIKADGTFKLVDTPKSIVARDYRVFKPGDDAAKSGYSEIMRVTVYRWLKLGYLAARAADQLTVGTATINLDQYPASLLSNGTDTSGMRDYNLGKKCLRLRGIVGLDDDSDGGATGTVNFSGDGISLFTGQLTLANPQPFDLGISQVFRLAVSYTTPGPAPRAIVAVAKPEVLCPF